MIRSAPIGRKPRRLDPPFKGALPSRTSSYGPRTMSVAARQAGSRLNPMRSVAATGPVTGTKISTPPSGSIKRAGRPMGAPAEVADERLQLVERGPDVAVVAVGHRQRRDGLRGERSDDDVRLLGTACAHLDPDVERREAAVDLAPLALELASPSLEGGPEVRSARDEPADLGQAEAHVAERHDPAELRQLGRRVVAVVGRGVDPDRPEQAERVVRAKNLRRDAGQPRERTDREHAGNDTP